MAGNVANFSGFHMDHHWSNVWHPGEADRRVRTVIDFKGVHYPKAVILHAVFFYVRYAVVIPPFLTGCIRRTYATILSFWAGVMPPMPMFGRSLL
jgi:hypothetical protein